MTKFKEQCFSWAKSKSCIPVPQKSLEWLRWCSPGLDFAVYGVTTWNWRMGLFLSRAASRTEGNGLNLDEMQCSKNMMHKANHECILLLGSSAGLTAPSPELSTDCLPQFFHSQYLRPQKNCFNSCKKCITSSISPKAVCCWRRVRINAFHSVLWALQYFSRFTGLLRVNHSQTQADSAMLGAIQAWASSNLKPTYSH